LDDAVVPGALAIYLDVGDCLDTGEEYLGNFDTVDGCAEQVINKGGKFFTYSSNDGSCYWEFTPTEDCPAGLSGTYWLFYKVSDSGGSSDGDYYIVP